MDKILTKTYNKTEVDSLLSTKLSLSGGTMTGQIVLASTGLKTSHVNGFTTDLYGNIKHSSSDTNNYLAIQNNAGTSLIKFYYETGKIICTTPAANTNNTEVATTAFVNTSNYYQKNDTYSQNLMILPGFTTSGNQNMKFGLFLPKYVTGRTITLTTLIGAVRGKNGYVDGLVNESNLLTKSGYTITTQNVNGNYITISITSNSVFTNIDNNNEVVFWGSVGLSFS